MNAANHPSSEAIGFIGLGAMGAPMARRLVSLGHKVLVHDVNAKAVEAVVAQGARAAVSLRALAEETSLVMTCLPSLEVLRLVVLGAGGLAEGGAIRTLVDFSTTGAHFARELSGTLEERGIQMLDAPITGNVVTAGNGKLGIMCSGPAPAFERAKAIMGDLASTELLYLGERNGKAQTLKLLNNLLSATGMAASCEAFILGTKAGLDPQALLDIVNAGEASSSATRNKFPKAVLPRRFDFGARMAITAKDTSLTVKECEELGVPMWIGQQVRQIWNFAVSQGGAERDGTSLITYLEPLAGVEVRLQDRRADEVEAPGGSGIAFDELVVVCDERLQRAMASRLKGWVGLPHRLVCVEGDGDVAAAILALPPTASRRAVVNTCVLPAGRARELALVLGKKAVGYLDAPLSGTPREVESHRALAIASGPMPLRKTLGPLLEALAGRVFWVSSKPGDAQLARQIEGALSATLLAVSGESFVAGAKAGLDPLTMTRILGIETGRNAASAKIVPEQVATRRFDHGRLLRASLRDLNLVSDAARDLGVPVWILDKARLIYGLASQLGSPEDDVTRLIQLYERWAQVEVKAGGVHPV